MLITVDRKGVTSFVYHDDLAELAKSGRIFRASNVEPGPDGWTADLSPVEGPALGPFPLRSTALTAEIAYLEAHVL